MNLSAVMKKAFSLGGCRWTDVVHLMNETALAIRSIPERKRTGDTIHIQLIISHILLFYTVQSHSAATCTR